MDRSNRFANLTLAVHKGTSLYAETSVLRDAHYTQNLAALSLVDQLQLELWGFSKRVGTSPFAHLGTRIGDAGWLTSP